MTTPDQIGPYEIQRELGRGGMGVVYLARDTRLDRQVAIKALPAELASDPARLERFEREAKTLAQLNHPNLAGIHGVEEQDGNRYLVLEYVEGESLADRLDRSPLPVDESVEYAVQVAAGLEAAHDAGVIHRDLKPANVMVTPDGQAKVLDFGLARTDDGGQSSTGALDSPTMTSPQPQHSPTIAGAILGTAAYMSPEQARGRRVDKRTDIWSFGVLLYEMLVGTSPFHGETATDSIGAVLHKDPNLDRLPPGTPASVMKVLRRCLQRDRTERYHSIADARLDLADHEVETATAPTPPARGRWAWAVAGVGALALLGASALWVMRPESPRAAGSVVRLTIAPPADAQYKLSGDLSGPAVVSRDGTRIAFSAVREGGTRRLWIRDLSESESRELEGTDGAMFPFWSPDGRRIGFFTRTSLVRYDTVSDTVERVCGAAQGRGGAWTEGNRIIFAPAFRGPLHIVDASGGEPEPFTALDEDFHTSHRWPFVIPGTERVLFIAVSNRPDELDHNGIYQTTLNSSAPPQRLMRSNFSASYADGQLLYVRDGALLARPFDADSGTFTGESRLVARDVAPDISTWHAQFSVSAEGVLIYGAHASTTNASGVETASGGYAWDMLGDRISSYSPDGRANATYIPDTPIRTMRLNDQGTMFAYETIGDDEFIDIWLHSTFLVPDPESEGPDRALVLAPVLDGVPRRFTSLPGAEVMPTWSPDGQEIAFRWDGDATHPRGIYRKRIGDGAVTLVRDSQGADDYPVDWTPDGKYIIFITGTLLTNDMNNIFALPVDGGEPIPLVTEPGSDVGPTVSPDGRWLAYTRVDGGRWEIRVIPFAPAWPDDSANRQWVVSQESGIVPRWSPEGDELYYIGPDAQLFAVDVDTSGDSFVASPPRMLFQTNWDVGRTFYATPRLTDGGRRFLFVDAGNESERPLRVVLRWQQLLNDD